MSMKHSLKALFILIAAVLAVSVMIAEDTPVVVSNGNRINDNDILAEYDGGVILRKDLQDKIAKLPPQVQGRYKTADGQKQVLDIMATEEIFMAKAKAMGIDKDPEVLKRISDAEKQFYVQEFYQRNVAGQGFITDEMKHKFYNDNQALYYVMPYITIDYIQTSNEDDADKAKAELLAGSSWESVSDKFNVNVYAKGLKGRIKNIRLNGNIPGVGNDADLEKLIAAATAADGSVHGPVKTITGWSLFTVVENIPGTQKSYEDVAGELEQRIRPTLDAQNLTDLIDRLKIKYNVVIDSTLVAQIDLRNVEANRPLAERVVVNSSDPNVVMTVNTLMEVFGKISPQEQMYYVKGEGANQLISQELIRALLYVEAKEQNYLQYFENNPEYVQMKRYHILTTAYKQLVVDTIQVTTEDSMNYYEKNKESYTTPESRTIEILWFDDQKVADRTRKLYNLAVKVNNEKKIQSIIKKNSLHPERSVLDNQYNNGTVTGIGKDENFSKLIWDTPVGQVSPVITTTRGEIVFFRVTGINPAKVTPFAEMEPRIYGSIKKEKEKTRQDEVIQELSAAFHLTKYPERVTMLLSAEELFEMANTAATQRNYKDAVVYYDQIISTYKNGKDDYKATFMKAFLVSEEMKDKEAALAQFKKFITDFPEGDLHESARFMIDVLEGKTDMEFGGEQQ